MQPWNASPPCTTSSIARCTATRSPGPDANRRTKIVGDTFLVAWRRFDELPEEPLPWLLGVARNRIQDQARQTARRSTVEQQLNPWTETDEQPGADPAELVTDRVGVLAALATLGAEDRELLTLVAWQGLTPAAAAEVIGCSAATCYVRLHRARRRLEQALRDQNDIADAPAMPPISVLRKGFSR